MSAVVEVPAIVSTLRKFTGGTQLWSQDVFNVYNYRGGGAVNYDLCATNGCVFLCVHGCKANGAAEQRPQLQVEWWWALSAIEDQDPEVFPAREHVIARVPAESLAQLRAHLPGLAFKEVPTVIVWSHGRGKPKKVPRAVDQTGIVFFQFDGGTGFVAARAESEVAA